MEFERSIFRMHERMLQQRSCSRITKQCRIAFCFIFIYTLAAWVIYHKLYVSRNDVLIKQMEEQLLSHYTSTEYQHLSYSDKTDHFIFCNKVSFNRNDTEGLVDQAVQKTNQTKAQASHKSNEELITELKFLPCEFGRDELFSFVVMNDDETAR